MLLFKEDMPWWDYYDDSKPRLENGIRQLRDDTPEDIVKEYKKYLEMLKHFS